MDKFGKPTPNVGGWRNVSVSITQRDHYSMMVDFDKCIKFLADKILTLEQIIERGNEQIQIQTQRSEPSDNDWNTIKALFPPPLHDMLWNFSNHIKDLEERVQFLEQAQKRNGPITEPSFLDGPIIGTGEGGIRKGQDPPRKCDCGPGDFPGGS